MENEAFMKVALRHRAIYCDVQRESLKDMEHHENAPLLAMVSQLAKYGYTFSEELLHALSTASADRLAEITSFIKDVMNVELNWVPLVKGWNNPTGESLYDHVATAFANLYGLKHAGRGNTLPCGHFIPNGTFPLERYNGCPFCGTPFHTAGFVYEGQGSKLKELCLFTHSDMENLFHKLLTSTVPLDATQLDSLKSLAAVMDIPTAIDVPVKEHRMLLISALIKKGQDREVLNFLSTPTDILRYLWYEKTGKAIIIRPKHLIKTAGKWNGILSLGPYQTVADMRSKMKQHLRLKYDRTACRRVATWLNAICTDAIRSAEEMHPYRGMWVRFIRALRLAEYSKKPGFEQLALLMDVFCRQEYQTWGSKYNQAVNLLDKDSTFKMLSLRPGLFARSLFATMLRFGTEPTLNAFRKVAQQLPMRLVLSLTNAAESYFNLHTVRYASPTTGGKVLIKPNRLLTLYTEEELQNCILSVGRLYEEIMYEHFSAKPAEGKSIYIDPRLYDIPIGVGDRSTTLQDISCALQGTRFLVEGNVLRLFLQWGVGLSAQPLDLDLSAMILYDNRRDDCAYYHLATTGARHSGDIRSIPDKVGTAEYIDLDLPVLREAGARYVAFSCNAYSTGKMSPNVQVGWMNAEYPMKISEENGVAYDPSCVQHMVRVTDDNIAKGMIFGVLDVEKNEITWLELPNQCQATFQTDAKSVTDYLEHLRAKCSIGKLLSLKAQAQGLCTVDNADDADCAYTYEWALNPAEVNALLG